MITVEILAIMKWISNNMEEIISNGIIITDVVEEPMAHPHYHSRTVYTIEYGEDDYGTTGIVADMGLSGSPSAWNHYRQVMKYEELAEDIFCRILEAEDETYNESYKVFIREDLYEAIKDASITQQMLNEW